MFDSDAKIIQRMAPLLKRVLIADPQPASARLIADLMRNVANSQVWTATTNQKALNLAKIREPDIIFVELACEGVDGLEFTRRLRLSDHMARYAPVIVVTGHATAGAILAARDAGVHEFLRKPFTMKDLLRRLEAVTLRRRDWVEAVAYVGPDRRRFNSGDYTGPLKRRADEPLDADRVGQALKILRAAVAACETDPDQALRSLKAQTAELQKAGAEAADTKLTAAAADLASFIGAAEAHGQPLSRPQLEARAALLLAYLPTEIAAAA